MKPMQKSGFKGGRINDMNMSFKCLNIKKLILRKKPSSIRNPLLHFPCFSAYSAHAFQLSMHFSLLDWVVVLSYIAGVTLFGIFKGGKQASAKDYFLSEEKIRWWAVGIAIVATETSALTFISVPGIAYKGNFNFLQLAIGYFIGRVIVAYFFLPKYYTGELTTAYALMESRFGLALRRLTSLVFIFTRIFCRRRAALCNRNSACRHLSRLQPLR
jgi:uncharacterized protein (UPF0333 family)